MTAVVVVDSLYFCLLFVFFVSGPFNWEVLVLRICSVCHVKLFIKSLYDHYSVDFLGKGWLFLFEWLFRVSTLLYTSPLDFWVEFIILACWCVIPVQRCQKQPLFTFKFYNKPYIYIYIYIYIYTVYYRI